MAIHIPDIEMTTIEWLEQRGCKSKRDFSTKAAAKAECKMIKKHHGKRLYPYKCRFCDKWHISRSKPRGE